MKRNIPSLPLVITPFPPALRMTTTTTKSTTNIRPENLQSFSLEEFSTGEFVDEFANRQYIYEYTEHP